MLLLDNVLSLCYLFGQSGTICKIFWNIHKKVQTTRNLLFFFRCRQCYSLIMCCHFITYLDNLVQYARHFGTDTKRFKQQEIQFFFRCRQCYSLIMCCHFVTYLDNLVQYAGHFGTDTKRFKQCEIGFFR